MKIIQYWLCVTLFFMLQACEQGAKEGGSSNNSVEPIEILNPWLRQMPEGSKNTAGFLTIRNNTGKPLILKDVTLDWANMAMLHESKVVDGMARMLHKDSITIKQSLNFQPGGLHIMIMGIKEPLQADRDYHIRLHFEGREPLEVAFKLGQANR